MPESRSLLRLMLRRHSRAVAAVEFALIAPVLIVMIGAVVDLGRGIERAIRLESIARTAAQSLTVGGLTLNGGSNFVDIPQSTLETLTASLRNAISPAATLSAPAATCFCPNNDADGTLPNTAMGSCADACVRVTARIRTISVSSTFTPIFPTSSFIPFNNLGAQTRSVTVRL
jgi:Flp pilus assembly protein TadG